MTTDLIKEAEYIIETYGPDTIATKFARNVIEQLSKEEFPYQPDYYKDVGLNNQNPCVVTIRK